MIQILHPDYRKKKKEKKKKALSVRSKGMAVWGQGSRVQGGSVIG